MAKLARREEPRRVWPWVVAVALLVLALAGGVGWWFQAKQGDYGLMHTLTGHQGDVTSVAFSPDLQLLASGSVDRTIKLWDVPTWQLKRTLTGHENYVESVDFSPDGHLLASGSADSTIKIWEVATGNLKQTLKWNGNSVLSVAFGTEAHLLASGSWDKTIGIWDVASGTLQQTLTGHQGPVNSVVFSPDGRLLASGGAMTKPSSSGMWRVGEVVKTLSGHEDKVTCVDFQPGRPTAGLGERRCHCPHLECGQREIRADFDRAQVSTFDP
jgi:WD40 repeat protein